MSHAATPKLGRLRHCAAAALLGVVPSSFALTTASIVASTLSPDCLEYRITGVCYWLRCTLTGCSVRTSVKVSHYVPDAVVSSYSNTGANPWVEIRVLSMPNPSAQAGGDGTTHQANENNLAKFKNADAIGHPGGAAFAQFAAGSGYACQGAGQPFMPYLLSTLDTLAWRYNVPEAVYPEALVPGTREIGARRTLNLWGSVYPRGDSCIRQTTTRRARWARNGRAMSSPGGAKRMSINRCWRARGPGTGRPARCGKAMRPRESGKN